MDKFIALVPMKAHSVRVKNKNMKEITGQPLFYYILKTLMKCEYISEIYVDTDGDSIKDRITRDFKNVHIIDRPKHLIGSNISMNSVIEYDLSQIKGENFLQTHATNPLLKAETIDMAIEFFTSHSEYDSLFSVTKMLKRYYNQTGTPINHDPNTLLNTQDLEPLYEENSCIYLFTKKSFGIKKHRIGNSPHMFEINREEAIDIDDEFEFELVNDIMNRKHRI